MAAFITTLVMPGVPLVFFQIFHCSL
jgi:hypothetical protein